MKTKEIDIHSTTDPNRFPVPEIDIHNNGIITGSNNEVEKTIFDQLQAIHNTLSLLGDDFLENINTLTALCGKLLNASSALYNRLDNGLLCSYGKWNTAPDHIPVVKPEGRICYDVIIQAKNDIYCVRNLPETSYAKSDPNVLLYRLKTYIGHMVRCNREPVGSLCVVFLHDFEYTETDRYIISLIAVAIEGEETRESLRKSKNRYRELFDFAVEGILIGSPQGIITESNNSIYRMTGFSNEELVGRHISEVMFTPDSLTNKPFRFDLLKQGQQVTTEREILCRDKSLITVEMHSNMMPDQTFQTVIYDITDRKETETKLKLSENTYRGIIDSLSDAIYILDQEGCFLDVNKAAQQLYNYEKEYFLHKNPEFLSAPGLNDLDQTITYIRDAFNGKPARFEFWGLRKDGSVFPKEISLTPGIWFGQKVVIAVGREMTMRKHAEEALKISEEKYRLLVQYSSDPIFSFNPDETYRFVNDAFANPFGKKPEDIIGKTPFDVFPHEEAEKRLKLVRNVFQTGEKGEIEVKVRNIHDEEKYFITMVDPIKDTQGNIMWVTCISKDITQRKKAEEELRLKNDLLKATNAEKDKFFSIVAHDLRGPMNGFLGLTAIMADDIEELSAFELKEIATTMRTSAVNIYRLIENLLEWSKMQRGKISFEPQPMFLKSALTKSIELMMDTANKKGIELRINIPEHNVVFADIHMLETIVRNLISNAVKFSFKGGVIEISASKTGDEMMRIVVKDTGIGMNPEMVSKMFKLTENINRKGTEGEPSTGLGLILCKEFVEKQGGTIWVESIEGEGSSFIFTLPQK
jgi:PAS domain S-box-containing protein